jgi:hypothetical protein
MYQNKIVVRYSDGRLQKGTTVDFVPNKDSFHVMLAGTALHSKPPEIRVAELKAVFFVRDLAGNPHYKEKKEFEPGKPVTGRKIKVLFKDGELMVGTTTGYQPGHSGFFVSPVDTQSNIERCFVVTKATSDVKFM